MSETEYGCSQPLPDSWGSYEPSPALPGPRHALMPHPWILVHTAYVPDDQRFSSSSSLLFPAVRRVPWKKDGIREWIYPQYKPSWLDMTLL